MKKSDFEDFKISLNLNIEVDSSLRCITQKIKFIANHRDPKLLRQVVECLKYADNSLDNIIDYNICSDGHKEN